MRTYTFPVDDGLAVFIPKELAESQPSLQEVEIERVGGALVIRPVARRKLTGLAAKFAAFPAGFMAEGREFHEQRERDWGDTDKTS